MVITLDDRDSQQSWKNYQQDTPNLHSHLADLESMRNGWVLKTLKGEVPLSVRDFEGYEMTKLLEI